MRLRYAIAIALAVVFIAARSFQPIHLPPTSVVGNPLSVKAPAQAILLTDLQTALAGTLMTNQSIPSKVNLQSLPPQTVLGNPTGSTSTLAIYTFNTLNNLLNGVLPGGATFVSYDPNSVPADTIIGNVFPSAADAVPISLATLHAIFNPTPVPSACGNQLFLQFSNSCAIIAVTNFGL